MNPAAVITGSGRPGGIGLATARSLLLGGWDVCLSDLPGENRLEIAVEFLRSRPGLADLEEDRVAFHPADVTDENQVDSLGAAAVDRFGRYSAWINNAGIAQDLGPVAEMTDQAWNRTMDILATGTFHGCRTAVRHLLAGEGGGAILNVSSQAGKSGKPLLAHYCAAKFAVIGLTQALALEVARTGIRVNAVCPGMVDTQLLDDPSGINETIAAKRGVSAEQMRADTVRSIPIRRLITPEEVGDTIAFLCSPAASGITGTSVNIAGGEEVH